MGEYDDSPARAPRPHDSALEQAGAPATARAERGPEAGHDVPAGTQSPAAVLRLQRSAGNAGVAQLLRGEDDGAAVRSLVAGGGRPLETSTRVQMEQALGADFSDVRVHTGSDASASARSLGAHAYTVGSDIVFGDTGHDPSGPSGQRTLAHELTHVVQQRSGPVEGTPTGTGLRVSDPSDRFEQAAEASADRVMAGQRVAVEGGGAPIQREAMPDEEGLEDETAQGNFVQREEAPTEEEELA